MDATMDELDPAEFAGTAARAVAACAALDPAGRAARLAEDGLLGVLAGEEAGGLGLGLRFAVPVLSAAGAGDLAFPLLETLLLTRLLAGPAPEVAAALVAGEARGTIAWAGRATPSGDRLSGVVGRAPMAAEVDRVLVRLEDGGAALVEAASARVEPAIGLDVTAAEARLRLDGAAVVARIGAAAWDEAEEEALILRAALILGAAETCIALAAEHAATRRQFGKPLVANQAIRHLLARHKLGLEGIRGAVVRALTVPDSGPVARRAAFLAAAVHGPLIAEGAIQVHGGMGFTWEVPVHRYLRRIMTVAAQGEPQAVREAVAAALIDANEGEGA